SRAIHIETCVLRAEVDDIGGPTPVYIAQPDASRIVVFGVFEPWRVIHRHLGAEAAVAKIRPVAHVAIPDAHQVVQSIARHVGSEDGLRAIGEDEMWPGLLVARLWHVRRLGESLLA